MIVWEKIKNYNDYEVNNIGEVRSLKTKKILKPSKTKGGYLQVVLCENKTKKTKLIHRLVANAFINNINHYKEINHKDENKLNNNVENLEWCTRKYNMAYGNIKKKQSEKLSKKVAKYDKDLNLICIYNSIKEASSLNNAKSTNIVKCCKHYKHFKTCKGFRWEYIKGV